MIANDLIARVALRYLQIGSYKPSIHMLLAKLQAERAALQCDANP